jgi:hypothetical protein
MFVSRFGVSAIVRAGADPPEPIPRDGSRHSLRHDRVGGFMLVFTRPFAALSLKPGPARPLKANCVPPSVKSLLDNPIGFGADETAHLPPQNRLIFEHHLRNKLRNAQAHVNECCTRAGD